ncbi:MAG: PorT family protein [Prolixibacteraceae bacterium]|nr:PorT family protein [Prolixibacteraceae bacterium]
MKTILRKTIVACTFIILSTALSFGQFQVGITSGVNFSTQSKLGNLYDNDNILCNFNAGVLSKYQLNDWFALKASVLYSQKGKTIEEDSSNETNKFSYLEVPVKAEFSTTSGKTRFFAATGPYAGFLLEAKNKADSITTDLNDHVKSTDLGLAFELGLELPVSKQALQFSINYDMGFTKFADYDDDLRNKTLSLNVGWLF